MSSTVWLVTGASSGIGLAIAQHVLSQGDKVIATARSLAKFPADKLKGATPLVVDFNSSDEELRKAAETALALHGHVDVLVNNAGYGVIGPMEELRMKDVRAQFQTNLFGLLCFTQALLPSFRAQGSGHILNMSSVGAINPGPSWSAYSASKAALESFSDTMSLELEPFGIRVLSIEPGYFSTRFFESSPSAGGKLSDVYTLPSQGYNSLHDIPSAHVAAGQIGDAMKLAERVYEVVTGTGLAKGLVESQGGKRAWTRVPLGPDCGEGVLDKLGVMTENVWAFEAIWRSTDVEPERLECYLDG